MKVKLFGYSAVETHDRAGAEISVRIFKAVGGKKTIERVRGVEPLTFNVHHGGRQDFAKIKEVYPSAELAQ